ncbi:hypothetical protein [Streptomyces sp. CB02115]|uniref:hypothetical protein n=1 Tax=Streptomyces sp. CB02115 TaxID=1703939 RepID=UPI00093C7779|nr:hypothetical protein [Streptomyces sp. CB02115]OKJ55974.1 hypothetical protein AMK28_14020 [Streptomyces sp. CB02115]
MPVLFFRASRHHWPLPLMVIERALMLGRTVLAVVPAAVAAVRALACPLYAVITGTSPVLPSAAQSASLARLKSSQSSTSARSSDIASSGTT